MAFLDETGLAHFWNQILARLNNFVPAESGKGLSSNDYTTEEKEKIAGIEVGANKTIVDSTLSSTSTNPVQNKIINTKFDSIQEDIDSKVDVAYGQYAITTAGDGSAYTATVPGITALTAGASFIMIPHTASTTTSPTLNVNGFGAKNIRRRLTSMATSAQNGYTTSWLASGVPFRVIYDGTQWIVEGHDKPAAADLYGAAPKATADANGNNIVDTYLNKTGDTMTGALCFTEGVGFGTGTPASTITNPVEGQFYLQIISE